MFSKRSIFNCILMLALLAGMGACQPPATTTPTTTPDTPIDLVEKSPSPYSETIIITTKSDSGPGSLRQALLDAQPDNTIIFDLAVFPPDNPATIIVSSELPHISINNLTLDASDAGVILDGSTISDEWVAGLQIVSSKGNKIMGLQISNFTGPGIAISGDSTHNLIGGDHNLGSGPFGQGNMAIHNAVGIDFSTIGTTLNTVTGNLIGTDPDESEGLSNRRSGVLFSEGTHDNTIGPDNIIAYNVECGVGANDADSTGNTITQNNIFNNGDIGICLTEDVDTEMAGTSPGSTGESLPDGQIDIIFHNGNIFTMEEDQPNVQAIAIQNEFIVAVGTDEEILALTGEETQIIDLNNLTMTPGFIDSHTHRTTQRDKWNFSSIGESSHEWVSQGWTGLVELAVDADQLKQMIAADAAGELHTRINAYLVVNTFGGEPLGDWYQQYEPHQQFSPYLRVAGLKIFIDYDSGRVQLWTQNDLNQFIRQRQLEGWQVTVKAVGIQSHDLALNAYEYAMGGDLNGDYRYRIEHSVGSNDEQVARMAEMGIIASIQPCFPATIWNWEDIRNLAQEQGLNNMFQWRNYLNGGVLMTASPLNPPQLNTPVGNEEYLDDSHISVMGLIYRSITQIGLGGTQPESWMLDRALTVNELLPMLTNSGAYATFEEDIKGSFAPGKWADLVILSDNPLVAQPNDIKDIEVLVTIVNGKTEYCASDFSDYCP